MEGSERKNHLYFISNGMGLADTHNEFHQKI